MPDIHYEVVPSNTDNLGYCASQGYRLGLYSGGALAWKPPSFTRSLDQGTPHPETGWSCWLFVSSLDYKRTNLLNKFNTPTQTCAHRWTHLSLNPLSHTLMHTYTHTPHSYFPLHSILLSEKQGTLGSETNTAFFVLFGVLLYLCYPSP